MLLINNMKNCFCCHEEVGNGMGWGNFCSHECQSRGKDGKGLRWKGGRRMSWNGYVLIFSPNHPNAVNKCVREHRLVMEKYLGRYLEKYEKVHHINKIKTDNRIENLELFSSQSEHLRREHEDGTYRNHLEVLHFQNRYA